MSPPVAPTLVISPAVTIEKERISAKFEDHGLPVKSRSRRHSPTKASAPVTSMKNRASIAAPSCLSIRLAGTAASFLLAPCAPTPLKNVGRANNATPAKTIRLARLGHRYRQQAKQ